MGLIFSPLRRIDLESRIKMPNDNVIGQMSESSMPSGISKTALGVAMIRAEESKRPDKLFDDPYAAAFLKAAPNAFEAEQRAAEEADSDVATWGVAFWSHAVVRTRFFDDWLLSAAGTGIHQVVLLAAGLDTRAFRLPWPPDVILYEVDLPELFAFKEKVLDAEEAVPRCDRRVVAADLREEWSSSLVSVGFQATNPTAWLIEGLFIYLSAQEAADLLGTVNEQSAAGSELAFECESLGTDPMRAHALRSKVMAAYSAMWKGGLPEPASWLSAHGWRPESHDRGVVATQHGRPAPDRSTGAFITAVRL